MERRQGLFIALEGADGSGKGTQFNLLSERLKAMGYELEIFDFPRYEEFSSYFVRQYLNGAYGPANSISPYTASIFYALDRYEAAPQIKKALKQGKIVLANRYVGSNMAHQGSKFANSGQQRGFFVWADGLEYSLLGIPRPDVNIFLRVPAEIAYKLIAKKKTRSYTSKIRDEHEADIEHLKKSVETYGMLSRLFPKDFKAVECTENGKMLGIVEINNRVWEVIRPLLPEVRPNAGIALVVSLDKLGTSSSNMPLDEAVEAQPPPKTNALKLSIKNISLFAANRIDSAKNVSLKMSQAKPGYYQLPKLSRNLSKQYRQMLSQNEETVSQIKQSLKNEKALGEDEISHAIQPLMPLSRLVDVDIEGEASGVESLIEELTLEQFEELQWLANQIAAAARQKNTSMGALPLPKPKDAQDYIALFTAGSISERQSRALDPARLLFSMPRNEFDSIIESIFPKVNLSRDEIAREIDSWPYDRKTEILSKLLVTDPTLRGKIHYRLDVSASREQIYSLLGGYSLGLDVQPPTIRYGYDYPPQIKELKLDSLYDECFDSSRLTYESFRAAGREELLPYLTLAGHKSRGLLNITLEQLQKTIQKNNLDKNSQYLLRAIMEQLAEVHPVTAAAIYPPSTRDKRNTPTKKPKKQQKLTREYRKKPLR